MHKVHVIAEAGNNHNGDPETARVLVDKAVEAGADSVKFQIIYPEGLYVPRLIVDGNFIENDVLNVRRKFMLDNDVYRELAAYCAEVGIMFSASVFDKRGIALLDELDVAYIKIASCDLNNSPLLRAAAACGRRLIVSTGMSTLSEVAQAVKDIRSTGHSDIVLMHCVSIYPCQTEQMNLQFIQTLKSEFGLPVGLSDHTGTSLAAAMGVALGVEYVEKHFTLDRSQEGFDHAYAMEPLGLADYVGDIRCATMALASSGDKVGPAESEVRKRARRSLYASRNIMSGDVIAEDDVLSVRPEGPMSPNDLDKVVGSKATRDIAMHEPFDSKSIAQ